MSTSNQYPKTNIVKLNPPSSSTTRDNNGADGVSFYRISYRIYHQLISIYMM